MKVFLWMIFLNVISFSQSIPGFLNRRATSGPREKNVWPAKYSNIAITKYSRNIRAMDWLRELQRTHTKFCFLSCLDRTCTQKTKLCKYSCKKQLKFHSHFGFIVMIMHKEEREQRQHLVWRQESACAELSARTGTPNFRYLSHFWSEKLSNLWLEKAIYDPNSEFCDPLNHYSMVSRSKVKVSRNSWLA